MSNFKTSWFAFQNEYGQQIDLGFDQPVSLRNPGGLGISNDVSFADIESGFFRTVKRKVSQMGITADLLWVEKAYEKYVEVADFMCRSEKLYLLYKPLDVVYYKQVELINLEKAIRDSNGRMRTKIDLKAITPWFDPVTQTISAEADISSAAKFDDARYDISTFSSNSASAYEVIISADGHEESTFVATLEGRVENPTIALVGEDTGTIYGKMVLTYAMPAAGKLELSTEANDSYIKYIASDGTEQDLIQYVDITQEPFPKIPLTERCKLSLTAPSVLSGVFSVTVKNYYRTV